MKRYFITIMITGVAGLMASCDMLDVDPKTAVVEEGFYDTPVQAEMALLGVYAAFAEDNLFGQRLSLVYPVQTDESRSSSTSIDNGKGGLVNFGGEGGAINPTNTELSGPFTTLYKAVQRANTVIFHISQMDILHNDSLADARQLRRYLGEALTLRALLYFELVKNWGDVPFMTAPTDIGLPATEYRLPRCSRDTIYDHIIADLLYAADSLLLPRSQQGNEQERVCRGAARGLLARICLHAAGYSLRWDLTADDGRSAMQCRMARRDDPLRIEQLYRMAQEQTAKVIASGEYALNPSYEQVFRSTMTFANDAYGENMFEVGFTYANNSGGGRLGVLNSGRQSELCKWSKGSGEVLAVPAFYIAYQPATKEKPVVDADGNPVVVERNSQLMQLTDARYTNDKRRELAVCTYEINDTNVYLLRNSVDYTAGKWRRHWSPTEANLDKDRTNINWVMLRYADVLLMNAEVEWYFGNKEEARKKVNMLRRRGYNRPINDGAGADALADVPTGVWNKLVAESNDNLSYAIVRERMLELCFEGLRKYDLLRWNIYSAYIGKARANMEEFRNDAATAVYPAEYVADYSINTATNPTLWQMRINSIKSATNAEDLLNSIENGNYSEDTKRKYYRMAELDLDKLNSSYNYFTPEKNELYPIPQSEIDANPMLTQCPSYR
ncbi:MAG: RagB/SusD family nutrient uptake outer membrane protein [Prevotellaceae bacterium]|jgi:hypothetical protein|nr:RagB/SusD family nutrient uptake outer membrane protein [Prevotellaceae bacterium]